MPCFAVASDLRLSWAMAYATVWLAGPALGPAHTAAVPIERDFSVRVWRKEHGLLDNRVLSLLVDRVGFLWIGTRKGVSRFDGVVFRSWSRSTDPAFAREECTSIAQDAEGRIWVGTPDGLLELGAPSTREAPTQHRAEIPNSVVLSDYIHSTIGTAQGELLAGTESGLLSRSRKGVWTRPATEGLLQNGHITTLAESAGGAVWAGTATQLYRRERVGAPWTKELGGAEEDETQYVHAVAAGRNGDVRALVGSWDHQRGQLLSRTADGWIPVMERFLRNESRKLFLFADSTGGLWFPVTGPTVGRWQAGHLTEYALPGGLAGDVFLCLAEDAEGNYWAGTERNGLVCLQPRRIRTLTVADGLPAASAWVLLEAADGALWVGTDAGVVRLKDEQRISFDETTGLAGNHVRALAQGPDGRVWIGTSSGLNVWDGHRLQSREFPGQRFRHKTRALQIARDGTVWVGTAQGLYRLRNGETRGWSVTNGLPHENVCALLEHRRGRLWLGTDGGGLARLTDTGFERYDEAKGLSSQRVWALHEDADGVLWVGTDRGLNVLREDRVAVLTVAQGLPDNQVNGLVSDRLGNLWIGHDRGIYRVRQADLLAVTDGAQPRARCVTYDEDDGLLALETNGQISYPPVIRRRDGRIAFATTAGVAVFDPAALPDLTNGPIAAIEQFEAGGRVLFRATPGQDSPATVTEAVPLRVPPGQGQGVTVTFTAPAFRSAEGLRFRYRLLGLEPGWMPANRLRTASYAHLDPGDYTFEVMAENQHGYASAQPGRLRFRVEPRFGERLDTRIGLAVTLAGLLGLTVRWRLRELRRLHQLEQEATLARERTQLAKDLHDGLGANLTEITLLSGLGEGQTPLPEAVASRLERLSRSTHEALQVLRDLIWTTNPKADRLDKLVARICGSAEHALAAAGLRCRIEVPAEIPALPLGPDFRKELLLAANEAVNNAIGHAQASEVRLRFRLNDEALELAIEDDGCGFDPSLAKAGDTDASRGLGLRSLRDRLHTLGGRCEIASRPGQGTRVRFLVSLPRA